MGGGSLVLPQNFMRLPDGARLSLNGVLIENSLLTEGLSHTAAEIDHPAPGLQSGGDHTRNKRYPISL